MKNVSLGSGTVALLIGIYLFVRPFSTTAMIGWFFALIVFVAGINSLINYFSAEPNQRSIWHLIQSIFSIVFGFILLTSSAMSLSGTVIIIAAYWALISGVINLIAGFQLRNSGLLSANRFFFSAVISILVGLFLLFNPTLSAIFIGRLSGLLLIFAGISLIANYFRLKKLGL